MAQYPWAGAAMRSSDRKPEKQTKKNRRSVGGYPLPDPNLSSETGLYESSPRGMRPVPMSRWEPGFEDPKWTYQNYDVPDFPGSPLVGMPSATAGVVVDGQNLVGGNTKADLDKILQSKNTRQIRALQNQMYSNGWITKQSITGKTSGEAFQSALAFMFYQGNVSGRNWREVLSGGPEGTDADLDGGGGGGGGGGGRSVPFGTPVTSTSENLSRATKGQARAYLKEALANVLGRGPRPGEFNAFLDALRDKETANPSMTVSTQTALSETQSESETETSGGMSAEDYMDLAETFAEDLDPKQAKRYKKAEYEQLLTSLIESV